jgi:RHS repeat-associated protein
VAHDHGLNASLVGLDRHGDVTWLAGPVTGGLSDSKVYDPFGEVAAVTGASQITVGFQGDYTDPATNEVWMGARWYDPTAAQFRSRDTIFGELMTPVSLNRRTYAFANPLVFGDSDGRFATAGRPLIDGVGGVRDGFREAGSHRQANGEAPSGKETGRGDCGL